MANSVPPHPLTWNDDVIEVTHLGSQGREFVSLNHYPILWGITSTNEWRSAPRDFLHDGDYFIRTAERDARKATMRFILLTCAVMACGFAIWWLIR